MWYCPMCEEYLQPVDVTFQERCVDCGTEVEDRDEEEEDEWVQE